MSEIKFLPKYEHRIIHYKFNNYVHERDCVLNINNAYEKGRADERAKIIDLIDRHMWNYSKEVWEDFQPVLKQLKEQK